MNFFSSTGPKTASGGNRNASRQVVAGWTWVVAALLSGCLHGAGGKDASVETPPWAGSLRGSGLRGFVLTESQTRRSTTYITATNHLGILKLERLGGLDADSASRLIDDGIMGLEALYGNALSPYPGDISNQVTTGAGFRPRRIGEGPGLGFLLYANDRFAYGVGTVDQVAFKSVLAWRYSPGSAEVTKIRLFVPASFSDELLARWLRSIECH